MTTLTTAPEQRLFAGLELRDVDTTETLSMIEGRAVPYNVRTNIGWYEEEFAASVFAKSIRESAIALPFLLFHDGRSFPIGVVDEWTEKADGLWGRWRLDTGDDMAMTAARKARDGFLGGLSVGFQPIRSEWTFAEGVGEMDRVLRKEARLLEVSLVSTPAYKDATVTMVRSGEGRRRPEAGTPRLDAVRAELDKLRAGVR